MIKIDLVTGFLGSGKTTFIRRYARYLLNQGLNIGILENDYGAVNVDMMLLSDLMGENCELEMISGGCCQDCHRRRFKSKLIAMGMSGYDRVIIEPSGIYDVDEFFDVLQEEPLDRWYSIGNVFAIVDASMEEPLSEASAFLLASEAANAGAVLLSHVKETDETRQQAAIERLNQAMAQVKCSRRFDREIWRKDWDELQDEDFAALLEAGFRNESYEKQSLQPGDGYDSLCFMNLRFDETSLGEAASRILSDPDCGHVYRVKGFSRLPDESWVQLNATRKEQTLQPIPAGQDVLIVIGEGLDEAHIRRILESFAICPANS